MKNTTILVTLVLVFTMIFGSKYGCAKDSGNVYSGEVKSSKNGKTWPATLKIISIDSKSGRVDGELVWPNLGSVHKIAGQLSGTRLSFKETEYIKKGSAHLNCEYTASFKNEKITGEWTDADFDRGTFQLTIENSQPDNASQSIDLSRSSYSGEVKSSKNGKTWPATLKIISIDSKSGRVDGELIWPNLGSVHKITGQLSGTRLSFKETEYIKKGSAHLNCEYAASIRNGIISGNWKDADFDSGTFLLKIE